MSDTPAPYHLHPEAPGTEPAGYDSAAPPAGTAAAGQAGVTAERLAEIQDTLFRLEFARTDTVAPEERYVADVPVLLAHVAALTARMATETAAAGEAKTEAVQSVLRDWRDVNIAELPELVSLPAEQMQERIIGIRVYFDLKSVELTGRRLEPAGIYAGIQQAAPDPVAAGFPGGNAAGYEAIRQQMAKRCAWCAGKVNGHGECARCEPVKVASHE